VAEEVAAAAPAEAVIASVLQDRPELAALGEERLQELLAEVMAEFQTGQHPVGS
jgi:hypothetical protein